MLSIIPSAEIVTSPCWRFVVFCLGENFISYTVKNKPMLRKFKVVNTYPNTKFEIGDILIQFFFETSKIGNYTYCTNVQSPLQGDSLRKEYVETMSHLFQEIKIFRTCPNCNSPNTREESLNPYVCRYCQGEIDTEF
jgi:hypothetical protein